MYEISETYRKHHYCNLYKRKERHLVCDHTGMEPNLQRQIQSLQSILINEEIQDKEIASVSYKYFYCKDCSDSVFCKRNKKY